MYPYILYIIHAQFTRNPFLNCPYLLCVHALRRKICQCGQPCVNMSKRACVCRGGACVFECLSCILHFPIGFFLLFLCISNVAHVHPEISWAGRGKASSCSRRTNKHQSTGCTKCRSERVEGGLIQTHPCPFNPTFRFQVSSMRPTPAEYTWHRGWRASRSVTKDFFFHAVKQLLLIRADVRLNRLVGVSSQLFIFC